MSTINIDTDHFREIIGARKLNDKQAVLAVRMVLAATDDNSGIYWSLLRKEWKGHYWNAAVRWAQNIADEASQLGRLEDLRDTMFYVLERAIPPRRHG
ncbi:hypothetical protein A5659_03645 [Mycobacterium sp. 1165196.3]|uniref:hypothetical protein n=1 Tax=Mycobacterium sp. 1165196.3 TaxID=1834071 RepID=UPI000801532E|nr:hypothetical protein [Mycobacterium sp. 1165196.3]OBK30147.1 hypothetical protein A5659_03645 [Mycobacterium sp. 1165196.3]